VVEHGDQNCLNFDSNLGHNTSHFTSLGDPFNIWLGLVEQNDDFEAIH